MRRQQRFFPYGLAIGLTAIAILMTLWLNTLLSPILSPILYIAIILTTWYGGFAPGIVSFTLSSLTIAYLLSTLAPGDSGLITEDLWRLAIFTGGGLVITVLTHQFRESKRKIERLSQQIRQVRQENEAQLKRELREQEKNEKALRESQSQLQQQLSEIETIYQSAPIGLSVLDRNLRFVRINHRLAEINGFTVEEHIGRNLRELLPNLADTAEQLLRSVLETGQPLLNVEIVGETPSQPGVQRVWLENFLPLKDEDRVIGISVVCEEITERKQTEAEIKEFNRRWRSVLDSIQMIVVELNQEGFVEYINPFFQKIAYFTPEEVIGKHWITHFTPPSIAASLDFIFQEVLTEGSSEHHINAILTKSGEERMIAWRNSVLKNNLGQTIGIIAIGEDITERYHLERMKSQFLSTVSHELRTPLTTIQASLSLLHDKVIDATSEEGETTISIATDGVDRLVRLVNDILDLERLRSGKLRLMKDYYPVQQILKNAIAQTQELAKQAHIPIHVSSPVFSLYADQDRLIQVLINLLSNAIKFSPPHSSIDLWVDIIPSEDLSSPSAIRWAQFTVSDRGRGIPPQNLESIFEPFQQVDASDAREKGGTGLGLAICRDIIQGHGGEIWVESVLGQGSTFYFTLPTTPLNADFNIISNKNRILN
ncbi:MAG: PAS domain-containing protein [Snowella sp.]|nr:PAS domain-containing protein [Snowella sp.]